MAPGKGQTVADWKKRVQENTEGEFFVDSTCIDCDTCRQLAPVTFEDAGNHSFVRAQPQNPGEVRSATQALLACPTGSIGTRGPNPASQVLQDFPMPIEEGVFYCGFNSPKSFGGNSYFIQHPQGNWLVDSPKFLPHLVKKFREMGGIGFIFLTHQDDVADAAQYSKEFGAKRIIHEEDSGSQPGAEIILKGTDISERVPGFKIIPTPGHTEGHCVLLFKNKFLFTGDHLWWRRKRKQLGASSSVAWYSWKKQTESMEKLLDYEFEWVLPGHGQRKKMGKTVMHHELAELVKRMKASQEPGWED
jgi:glyoxylase-like metal-dependent hydrolase (beta-lactamase superfamily II)/ferredoxin